MSTGEGRSMLLNQWIFIDFSVPKLSCRANWVALWLSAADSLSVLHVWSAKVPVCGRATISKFGERSKGNKKLIYRNTHSLQWPLLTLKSHLIDLDLESLKCPFFIFYVCQAIFNLLESNSLASLPFFREAFRKAPVARNSPRILMLNVLQNFYFLSLENYNWQFIIHGSIKDSFQFLSS